MEESELLQPLLMWSCVAGHLCSIRAGACASNQAKDEGCQDLARQGSHSHHTS